MGAGTDLQAHLRLGRSEAETCTWGSGLEEPLVRRGEVSSGSPQSFSGAVGTVGGCLGP